MIFDIQYLINSQKQLLYLQQEVKWPFFVKVYILYLEVCFKRDYVIQSWIIPKHKINNYKKHRALVHFDINTSRSSAYSSNWIQIQNFKKYVYLIKVALIQNHITKQDLSYPLWIEIDFSFQNGHWNSLSFAHLKKISKITKYSRTPLIWNGRKCGLYFQFEVFADKND